MRATGWQSNVAAAIVVALTAAVLGCGNDDPSEPGPSAVGAAVQFGAPVALVEDEVDDDDPSIVSMGDGTWLAVWARDHRIVASRSADGGFTWDPATGITGDRDGRFPAVGADGRGTGVVAWRIGDASTGLDVVAARTRDGGLTWSSPVVLSASGVDAIFDDIRVATDGSGTWIATWETLDSDGHVGYRISAAISRDDGATWEPSFTPSPSAHQQVQARIVADGAGRWVAVWGSDDPTATTAGRGGGLLASTSHDGGRTWTTPVRLVGTSAPPSRQDADADLASDGVGAVVAVWVSERLDPGRNGLHLEIASARSTDGGATWSAPQSLDAPGASTVDVQPRLASDHAGTVVVLWGSNVGPNRAAILVAQSNDGGVGWSTPAAFPGGGVDQPRDGLPEAAIASDDRGSWNVVWSRSTPGATPVDDPRHDVVIAHGEGGEIPLLD